MPSLSGRIGIVTGASRGIGKAIALALASEGVALGLVGRDLPALESVGDAAEAVAAAAVASGAALPEAPGPIARCYRTDLAKPADVTELAARLAKDFRRIDILVHSAGVHVAGGGSAGAAHAENAAFEAQAEVNARAPETLTRALLPTLRANHGQVVFINSSAALNPRAGLGGYAETKQALQAFADRLRDEVNPDVRVLSVFPGRTATPLQEAIRREEGKPYDPTRFLQPEDIASVVIHALRLPGTAEVTDIRIRPFRKVD